MGERRISSRARPKIHTPSTNPSRLQNLRGSSILYCAFTSSHFRRSLFASVVHEVNSQTVRVHDTRSRRILCNYPTSSTASVTCLDWGRLLSKDRDEYPEPSRKKRKICTSLEDEQTSQDGIVIAYGTNESRIHFLSPAEGKVVATLDGGHTLGIKDFKFSPSEDYQSGWSLGGDGNLVQWNLKKVSNIRTIPIVDTSTTALLPTMTHIFYASHTVHRINLEDPEHRVDFPASTTSVQAMVLSSPDANGKSLKLLTSTHSNQHMLVFDLSSTDILVTLIAQSDIISLSYFPVTHNMIEHDSRRQVDLLAVVTVDHKVEIFTDPFNASNLVPEQGQNTQKLGRRARVKKSAATVQLQRRAAARSPIRILKGCLKENALLIAWVEDGMNVCFEEIPCTDPMSGEFTLSGFVLLPVLESTIHTKRGIGLTEELKNGKRVNVNESHVTVLHGGKAEVAEHPNHRTEVIDISSAVEDTDSSDNERNNFQSSNQSQFNIIKETTNPSAISSLELHDRVNSEEAPSFGEMITAAIAKPFEVAVVSANSKAQELIPLTDRSTEPSTNLTFSVLLPQALGTNDNILLERCLHVADTNMIRATIERLNPTMAAALLQKLAERLHSRPGRAGTLLVWIQWTLVAHGGYLGTQIASVKKLGALYRTVRERANSLQPLLSLKGKLDMLEAQTNLRRLIQERLGNRIVEDQIKERAAVYVEGQDETSSEDDLIYKEQGRDRETSAFSGFTSPVSFTNNHGLEQPSDDAEGDDQGSEMVSSVDEASRLFDLEASESDQNTRESLDEEDSYDDVDSVDGEERSDIEELSKRGKVKSGIVNGIGAKLA